MYASLYQMIQPHIDKSHADLPADIKARVDTEFFPHSWGSLARSQRSDLAQQYDMQHDPAMAEENQHWFDLQCEVGKAELQITEWEAMGHQGIPSEARIKDEKLNTLRLALAALNRGWERPFLSKSSPATKQGGAQPLPPACSSLSPETPKEPRSYASLHELVQPYADTSYDDLPAEVQVHVAKFFTSDAWNASPPTGRSNWARRRDDQRDAENAELAQAMAKHAYWFQLQSDILGAEREIAELSSLAAKSSSQGDPGRAELASLKMQLTALHERWYQPDDLVAKAQLAAEKAALGQSPPVLDIPRALQFLTENTNATWTDAQLLSLVSNSDICLYAAISPWTPMYIVEWKDVGLRKRPFVKPGRSVLVMLSPDHVQQVWVSGETASSTSVSTEPFSVDTTNFVYLENPATVLRGDIRLTRTVLLQILKKWEASRHPIAPLPESSPAGAIWSSPPPELAAQRSDIGQDTAGTSSAQQSIAAPPTVKAAWTNEARTIATKYISAWRAASYTPTVDDAALYVEGVFSTEGILNTRNEPIDRETIKREALAGITGRKPGERRSGPKIPGNKRQGLP